MRINLILSGVLVLAMIMTACAVPGAPPYASIYPKGYYALGSDPGYVLQIDFERHTMRVSIQGESYAGQLVEIPGYRDSLQSQLLAASGATMKCTMNQLLPKEWDGQCTDALGHVYVLKVGGHWSV